MSSISMPYMFYYTCNNPTFGYDFQWFAANLGAKKVYGRYKGKGQGTYFYLVPTIEVYNKLKEVAKDEYEVEIQRLLRYKEEEYPNILVIKESKQENKPPLFVIKDSDGRQLSAPNADDGELWNRVASMEARGRRGLSVVVYTGPIKEAMNDFDDYVIQRVGSYFEARKNGKVICTGDTRKEVEDELNEIESQSAPTKNKFRLTWVIVDKDDSKRSMSDIVEAENEQAALAMITDKKAFDKKAIRLESVQKTGELVEPLKNSVSSFAKDFYIYESLWD